MSENQTRLEKEIERLLKELKALDPSTVEYSTVASRLDTLYKLSIENLKADTEKVERKKDRIANVGVQAGLAIGGWIAYDIWNRRGLNFEKTGTVGSMWVRNLIGKMLPAKKG